jgi:4-diphosphocytidyl-2-C-methyl-D-erythritol kinase
MVGFSNAKINIGLNILDKRSDGYHNISSVFYPVSWCDIIEVLPAPHFELNITGLSVPGDLDHNLIARAWKMLKCRNKAVSVHLHKILPMGAGIGGGSSNGAFALKLINEVLNLGLTTEELQEMASALGSDCPFFIENKPVLCLDRGTRFEPCPLSLNGKYIAMVYPGIHISTAEAYSGVLPHHPALPLEKLLLQPMSTWEGAVKNDFEKHILERYPTLTEVKQLLYQAGAVYASMTGSGSTVYGIFDEPTALTHLFPNYTLWEGKLY